MADDDRRVIDLWQNQAAEGFRMSQEEIEMKVQALDAKVRVWTRDMFLVSAVLMVLSIRWFVHEHDLLLRLAIVATNIAWVFFALQAYRNRTRIAPASTMAAPPIEHLRGELQRQAAYHRGKRLWSRMLLWVPAQLFYYFAFARVHPEAIVMTRFETVAFVVVTIVVIQLNLSTAKKYQRQIEELDR